MIKRTLLQALKEHLPKKEITFLVGPRQAGKTTLMLLLKKELEKESHHTIYFNLDIEQDKEYFISQERLIKKIELELGKSKGFVFIDEIQRKENAGLFLKGIYDMNLPYKFIVSGSGSVELKEKIHESLTGRKRIFELSTLSFKEFVNFKTNYKYENRLYDFFNTEKTKIDSLLDEYLNFGGYPRVVLENKSSEKQQVISEIYQSYLEKDISYLLKVQKTEEFIHLVKIMASQIGNLVNLSEISSTLGISVKTIKDYLWYLEKTFVLKKVTPYFKNIRKEITKSSMFYFYDLGLRNFAVGDFGRIKDKGFVFQNFVFNLLRENIHFGEIHFWRTKDKAEVDFVLEIEKEIIPIEVKYKELTLPDISRSLRSFIEKYSPKRALIVNLSLDKKIKINKTELYIIPFYKIEKILS